MTRIIPFRQNPKKRKSRAVVDEHLIIREYYNCNESDLVFKLDERYTNYILNNNISIGPNMFLLRSGDFKIVPHGYWIVEPTDGRPTYELITNFGDLIGKGNKKQSRPS